MIAVDIDGTIAGRNMPRFAARCREHFDLEIEDGPISYLQLMQHPTMLAHRSAFANEQFNETIQRIEQAPDMLMSLPVMPGAVEGVQKLSSIGRISYYTVRKSQETPPDHTAIRDATKAWLALYRFPYPNEIVFCMSVMNKLIRLYNAIRTEAQSVLLIDDMAQSLIEAFHQLKADAHPGFSPAESRVITDTLARHMHIVAFGTSSLEITSDLHVIPLPSWQSIDDLLPLALSLKRGNSHEHSHN